jgi:nicotinamidase-related amidase
MTTAHFGEATDLTYQLAGFGAAVARGARPAIVVVDLTRGFTEPSFPAGSDLTDVLATTNHLVATGRAAGTPVIHTAIAYTAAEVDSGAVRWLDKATGMRSMLEGSAAVAFDPRLDVRPEDHLIVKKGASAFHGTGLASLLASLGRDTVLIAGATTSGCIRATAVDAVQSGFTVLVPRECVGDRAQGPHEANLFDIQAKYGDVIALTDAVRYLTQLAE